jgi:tetratricopeptide (TPR) repeat protein
VVFKRTLAVSCVVVLAALGLRAFGQETPPPPPPPTPAPAEEGAPPTPPAEPDVAAIALQDAKIAFKQGIWPAALTAATKTLETQPKNLEALYIAGTSARQTNRLADADGYLKTLVEESPTFPLAHFQWGYVLFQIAEGLAKERQAEPAKAKYVEAATEFGKELERNPSHPASLSSRAIAYGRGGKIDESIQAHEAWITAIAQKNDPVVSLAATYAGAGRSSDAMAALDRLPDKSPKAVRDAALGVASVFTTRRDWGAAVPFLEKAADVDPESTKARALLTESCARAGLANDAARNLQTLLTMDPTPDEAESVGEAIKAGFGDGKSAPASPGVERPTVVRAPSPRFPKGQDWSTQTEVLVLALVQQDAMVVNTVMVPNRIWKDMRTTGFEAAAVDAVKKGKYAAGKKDGQPADLWIVVPVKFDRN